MNHFGYQTFCYIMALSSANRCYDFPLAEPGQSKRRARFFCVDGRKRSDAGQVRVRGGGNMECVLTPHSDMDGRGVRGSQNGIKFSHRRFAVFRFAARGHPAHPCPPVVASTASPYFPPPRTHTCPAPDRFLGVYRGWMVGLVLREGLLKVIPSFVRG